MAKGKSGGAKGQKGPSLLEWISAALGAMIVFTMIGFIGWQALTASDKLPPVMRVVPLSLAITPDGYVLAVRVVNRSSQTGAAVEIEGELLSGGTPVETSSATLTYVPGQSERRAGLIFTRDPRKHQLQLRVLGFEKP